MSINATRQSLIQSEPESGAQLPGALSLALRARPLLADLQRAADTHAQQLALSLGFFALVLPAVSAFGHGALGAASNLISLAAAAIALLLVYKASRRDAMKLEAPPAITARSRSAWRPRVARCCAGTSWTAS